MLVGFSLSMCVKDILEGVVKEEDVQIIFCGTNIRSKETFLSVIRTYSSRKTIWKDEKKAKAICYRLLFANKIIQARALGFRCTSTFDGHWKSYHPGFERLLYTFFESVLKEKDKPA